MSFDDDTFYRMKKKLERMKDNTQKAEYLEKEDLFSNHIEKKIELLKHQFQEAKRNILNSQEEDNDFAKEKFANFEGQFQILQQKWRESSENIDSLGAESHLVKKKFIN